MEYDRGAVVKDPDLFADHEYRPYVQLSDETHPFCEEEALYTAVTSTPREFAITLTNSDFITGGLPRESYVNPWTVVSIRLADIEREEGRLEEDVTEEIATEAARYLGVRYELFGPFSAPYQVIPS